MFIDKARLLIIAGNGGDGCISFRREKYVPYGGPDGGNGGSGGSLIFETSSQKNTLLDLAYKNKIKAEDGTKGGPNNRTGKCGADTIIQVPRGVLIYKDGQLLADLKELGQRTTAAQGGRGGRGNSTFKTQKWTAPRIAEKGQAGESAEINLELRLIADVGLVGLPNAGKSTLLTRLSQARPKIADYPFTTLSPNLGAVDYKGSSFIIADIPGIIEGAHTGKGLGLEFLRHIRRTKILVHVIDASGFDEKDPYLNYKIVNTELKKYAPYLIKKPILIALNKIDLPDSAKHIKYFKSKLKRKDIVCISAINSDGINSLLDKILFMLSQVSDQEIQEDFESSHAVKKYIYQPDFTITKDDDAFVVSGPKIETLTQMTIFTEDDALRRYQNILKKMGLEDELEKQGIKVGDTVKIGGFEFIYKK
jgi:GTP-binding protein